MTQKDVVIASLPYIDTEEPMMAPALLKGIVNKTELTSIAFDFNIESIHFIRDNFPSQANNVLRWFLYNEFKTDKDVITVIDALAKHLVSRILEVNPKWICLSLFCHSTKNFAVILCKELRKQNSDATIVVGGSAVFTNEDSLRPFGKILQKAKLIDYYIVGDGEEPLYDLLTGNSDSTNLDKFNALADLSKQPFSDYSDYNWDLYPSKIVPMYGSRGCVRKCTFCDVYKIWKKFKIRSAEDIVEEMKYQHEQTGLTTFGFRDSLINGSISQYRKFVELLTEFHETTDQKFKWNSFYIIRPENEMTENDWKLTSSSGANKLSVGVESFVEKIRFQMRKKIRDEDLEFNLKMAEKYNVKLLMLIIIGYVTETEEDFQKGLQWLEDHKQYASTCIATISVGGTLIITDMTDLYTKSEDFDITLGPQLHLWENKKLNLTYEVREARKRKFIETAERLGYKMAYHEKPVM